MQAVYQPPHVVCRELGTLLEVGTFLEGRGSPNAQELYAMPQTNKPKGRTTMPIAFSGTAALLKQIDEAAAKDGRNRSSWIVQAIREKLAQK